MKDIELWHGDCLEMMERIPEASVNMIFCDLPYSHAVKGRTRKCTANFWDTPIDLQGLWGHLDRASKTDCTIAFTATQPFASALIYSKPSLFKYDLIWEKARAVGFLDAKRRPMRAHEIVLIFQKGKPSYTAQKTPGSPHPPRTRSRIDNYGKTGHMQANGSADGSRYPRSVLYFKQDGGGAYHPTAKPVNLISWLIRTYTEPRQTILDPTAGGMSTAVAAHQTGRRAICIEKDAGYFKAGVDRVKTAMAKPRQDVLL